MKKVLRNNTYYELEKAINNVLFGYDFAGKLFDRKIIKRIELYNLNYKKELIDNVEWIILDKDLKEKVFRIFKEETIKIFNYKSNISISELTKEMLEIDFYDYEKIKEELEKRKIIIPSISDGITPFKNKKVSIVHLRRPINKMFFYKKHIDEILDMIDSYIDIRDIEEYNKRYTFPLNIALIEKKFNIKAYSKIPFLSKGLYVKKTDIDYIKSQLLYSQEMENTNTQFERLQIMIKYSKYRTNKVETIAMFLDYCRDKSNSNKNNSNENSWIKIYELLCSETLLHKELKDMSNEEQYDFSKKIFYLVNDYSRVKKEVSYLLRYLKMNYNLKGLCEYKLIRDFEEVEPYSEESFLKVLLVIFNILLDKETVIVLIDNIKLSGCLLYIYMHYCIAWRRSDLINQLPKPNMNLIGRFIGNNDFNDWIKKKENTFSEEMGKLICEDIEDKVKLFNLKSSKTNSTLTCIIPQHMHQTLGLLFCICESNRKNYKHIHNKNDSLILSYLPNGTLIIDEINENFNIDLSIILDDNFSNLRAVKSFLNIINNKSEEFDLACGYYLSQILRGHNKSKDKLLAETTKIYLNKDVSQASITAFLNGTMGCIKYNLLSIIDEEFDLDTSMKKLEKSYCLDITPKKIEETFNLLYKKSKLVDNFFKEHLTTITKKENFLRELFYGKDYGKHNGTKCLIKVMKSSENKIKKIGITDNNDCVYNTSSCIGCSYLVTMKCFIYEFEEKFNEMLESLEKSKSELDKHMNIKRFLDLYLPLIIEIQNEFGEELTKQILDTERYNSILKELN